jgi:hypothetical protein
MPSHVRILDADGRPVPGARVTVFERGRPGGGAHVVLDTVTDATGSLEIVGRASSGVLDFVVRPPSDRGDLQGVAEIPWRSVGDVVLRRGREVLGVVLDDEDRPVAAAVYVREPGGGYFPWPTLDDGTFHLRFLPPGPVDLLALPDADYQGDIADDSWSQVPTTTRHVRLRLRRGPRSA